MSDQLLSGLRVIEVSAFIAAPLAGLTLAQNGADVIRIDMIGGGIDYARLPRMPQEKGCGRSLYWTGLNKGKRSIAIDLRKPEGQELVQELATASDPDAGILLTNLGYSWLSHECLAARRTDLISCTIQGSSDGSTAVDYTINCATGYPFTTGNGRAEPVNHVLPAWDVACGHHAAFAITAAVNRRMRTQSGADIKLALSDMAFTTLSHLGLLAEAELLGQERPSLGNHLYGAFGRDFVTADGHRLMVVAISVGQWRALKRACDMESAVSKIESDTGMQLDNEAHRFEARYLIAEIIEEWFSGRSRAEVERLFKAGKVLYGPYQSVPELVRTDPRLTEKNPVFERVHTPGVGEHISARAPTRVSDIPAAPTRPAVLLGTHTDEILQDILGLSGGQVGKLHDQGIVAGPEADPSRT